MRDYDYVMWPDFLVKLGGVKIFDALDVKSEDILKSWPNISLKRSPVLVKGRNRPFVAN